MDLNPDADLVVRKKKKKKKKRKHAETPADYAWIKTEPETEWLSVRSQNLDFGTIDNNRTLGAPKETRKKKKKVKSEDPVENVTSVDAEMVCDFGISDRSDHSDEAKQIVKKKRKRKRKRSILQEAQSEETSSMAGDSPQEVQDGVEDCPLSFRAEPQSHKCKKDKKCKVQEQPSPGTLTADVAESQHIMPAVSEATKEKVADKSRKKKKHKAKDHLHSPMSGDADGDQTSGKITVTDTTEDDARHKKRKRKAQDKLNELHYEEPQGLADANCKNQDDLVSEGVGYPVRIKKGKRKKKDLDEHFQTGGSAESQISPNTVDMQEKLSSQEEDPKPRKRKKKSTGWNNGNDDPICLQSSEIEIGEQKLVDGHLRKVKLTQRHGKSLSVIIPLSPDENGSPSLDESPDPRAVLRKNPSPYKGQSGCSKAPAADRLLEAKASVFAGKMGWSSAAEEEDESWIQDLPFYVGTSTCTSLRRKPIQKEGVVLKKGYWKGHEDKILRENIENFCKKYGIDDVKKVTHPHLFEEKQALLCLIQQKKFYLKMCKGLMRLPFDVYLRSRKICDDRNYKGKFTKEEMKAVEKLKRVYGNKWSQIGREIERSGQSVLDWYRMRAVGVRRFGKWSEEEKDQLSRAVVLVTQSKEDDVMDKLVGIPWRKVCKMVPTRNIHQCRNHWKDKLCWSVGNRTRRRWTDAESADLIKSVYNLDVNEESDIDWVKLHKEFWERAPSPSKLSQMWYILKLRHLDNYHFMTFEEILDQLYHKVLPVLKGRLKKQEAAKAKMKSKESISSSEDDSSSEEDDDWY